MKVTAWQWLLEHAVHILMPYDRISRHCTSTIYMAAKPDPGLRSCSPPASSRQRSSRQLTPDHSRSCKHVQEHHAGTF